VLGLLRSPGCATAGSTADGELPAALAADGAAADGAAADGAAARKQRSSTAPTRRRGGAPAAARAWCAAAESAM